MRLCSRANSVCVGGQGDVLVGADVAGDHRRGGIAGERPVSVHAGRRGGVAAGVAPRADAAGQQQGGRVVREVAVDRALAQPLEPLHGVAVDGGRVDVAAEGVDLLANPATSTSVPGGRRRRRSRSRRGR